ncbi:MAG: hypothetical protein ACD_65C00130G0001 [uncultured bacterium]|nr:MAG: hypothetical protein ACD_65C00130G0001 [uncultured bacterium]
MMYICLKTNPRLLRSSTFVKACGMPIEQANSMILTEKASAKVPKNTPIVSGRVTRFFILVLIFCFCS